MTFSLRTALLAIVLAAALGSVAPSSASASHSTGQTHACGIKQLPVPDYISGVYNFRKSCSDHDVCYRSKYEGRRYARLYCDRRFRRKMNRHCDKVSPRPTRCRIAASTYYYGVRGPLGIWAYDVLTPQVRERKIH